MSPKFPLIKPLESSGKIAPASTELHYGVKQTLPEPQPMKRAELGGQCHCYFPTPQKMQQV